MLESLLPLHLDNAHWLLNEWTFMASLYLEQGYHLRHQSHGSAPGSQSREPQGPPESVRLDSLALASTFSKMFGSVGLALLAGAETNPLPRGFHGMP